MKNKIFWLSLVIAIIALVSTRLVNLGWGLPYPFHPDERNMAMAIVQLHCNQFSLSHLGDCFNPHFFAYGQFPLYLSYFLLQVWHLFQHSVIVPITYSEATLALRFIAAFSSIITVLIMIKIFFLLTENTKKQAIPLHYGLVFLIFIFSPALIQFAHFGTTESLLMVFFISLIYVSLELLLKKIAIYKFLVMSGAIGGLAIATKLSSLTFLAIPLVVYLITFFPSRDAMKKKTLYDIGRLVAGVGVFMLITLVFFLIGSPHNLISWSDFVGSIQYESSVAMGDYIPFYTQQFSQTIPVLFQFTKIFPYALGVPITALFLLGFMVLGNRKEYNLLRFSFLIYFLPSAFLFTKWTRFMAPIMPVMLLIGVLCFSMLYRWMLKHISKSERMIQVLFIVLAILIIIPGVRFLRVYMQQDIRFQASNWIFQNVPAYTTILSETANVVDIPVATPLHPNPPPYNVISFDFYNVDANPYLQQQLQEILTNSQYLIIPSRRLFANYTCLAESSSLARSKNCLELTQKYPVLNEYYEKLFSGKLGFTKVAEFSILADEAAEETWTVFDHPTIRIYKRN